MRKVKKYPTIEVVMGYSALRCKLSGRHPQDPPTMRRHFPFTALIDLNEPSIMTALAFGRFMHLVSIG